jgi:hypothetical protein
MKIKKHEKMKKNKRILKETKDNSRNSKEI